MASNAILLRCTVLFFISAIALAVGPHANVAFGAQDTPPIDSAPARESAPAASASGTPEKTAPRRLITAIRVNAGSPREERIIFSLDGAAPPKMFFIDGDPVRLVCDFLNAHIGADVVREIEAGGKLIQRVRIGVHDAPEQKVRVVVELIPGRDYEIDEYFRPQESSYELFIRPAGGIEPSGNG